MPTKRDLAALSSETQQPLRRGRGLRLSQVSKQARERTSISSGSPLSSAQPEASTRIDRPAAELAAEAAASAEAPSAPDAVIAEAADPQPPKPERDKRKIRLRKDLLKQCKRIARTQDRKLYQVIESALEEYIERHGAHE